MQSYSTINMDVFHILYSLIKPPACIKKWTFFGIDKKQDFFYFQFL